MFIQQKKTRLTLRYQTLNQVTYRARQDLPIIADIARRYLVYLKLDNLVQKIRPLSFSKQQ